MGQGMELLAGDKSPASNLFSLFSFTGNTGAPEKRLGTQAISGRPEVSGERQLTSNRPATKMPKPGALKGASLDKKRAAQEREMAEAE